MSSNSTAEDPCAPDDHLCITREHMQGVIIVPTLLLLGTLVTLLFLFLRRYCPERRRSVVTAPQRYSSSHRQTQRQRQRQHLQGIDAPPGLNPLEHEELPMSVQRVQQSGRSAVPQTSTERQQDAFSQITALPLSFSIKPSDTVSLYRARMDDRDVVLRVLKEKASSRDKQHFLDFASFVSGLGRHPFLPELLGVVSVQSPMTMVMEELQHRDLLGFLWRCRQDNSGPESMTEKRILIMAGQVSSALEYLHSKSCIHGNVGARSVLVGGDLTAKLWGLASAYHRRTQPGSPGGAQEVELRKWQAPEVLARGVISPESDVWSFGLLLYEMVTLGDPPFAQILGAELLQHLQRGRHLQRPPACSSFLFALISSCCRWNRKQRLSVPEVISRLQAGEKSANGRTVLRAQPIDIESYLREAGYGDAYNYAVL